MIPNISLNNFYTTNSLAFGGKTNWAQKAKTKVYNNNLTGKDAIVAEIKESALEDVVSDAKGNLLHKRIFYPSGYLKESLHYKNGKLILSNKYNDKDRVINELYERKNGNLETHTVSLKDDNIKIG